MEILIEIPTWLEDLWAFLTQHAETVARYLASIWGFVSYQRNYLWVGLSMVVFWPMWVYFAVGVTTASTWLFWLFTSALLGVVQLVYVTYQFIMIAIDVTVLTVLKTYQVLMRSRTIQTLFFFSKKIRNSRAQISRRREWKNQCEASQSYSDYLLCSVKEPKEQPERLVDAALEPRRSSLHNTRSTSMSNLSAAKSLGTLHESKEEPDSNGTSSDSQPSFRRALSAEGLSGKYKPQQNYQQQHPSQVDPRTLSDLGTVTAEVLQATTQRLNESRKAYTRNQESSLSYLLSGVVKRNHLTLEHTLVNNARAVSFNGQNILSSCTRKAISSYYDAVSKGLEALADCPVNSGGSGNPPSMEIKDRVTLFRKMKQNMGRTALMLSGGGAQAMYHLGTLRALIDADVYDDIHVISGTSGGSITAACCAMFTSKEIFETVCVPTVSTDFRLNGEMKKKNIRWFPPVVEMGAYWLKDRLLVDSKYFFRTCEFYYGTTTFDEAFERTGKHVCITVSASRAMGGTAQRLLLNHISTPHVTLASAVAASCALPGVMKPAKLQTKNRFGEIEAFEVDGVEWIDGSVQADLPFQRISTLFNVSNYIVCQTNFHVMPFLNKEYHPNNRSTYWKLFQTIEWDIRNRCLKLSKLGLFPRIFGQDISKVFKQKYHGDLTLVPRFTTAQTFGLKALVNPSVKDMEGYLKYGQLAAWPYLGVIRDMLRLEKALDECLEQLKIRFEMDTHDDLDDLDSIASSGLGSHGASLSRTSVVRFTSQQHEVERLRLELSRVERENASLREQVESLRGVGPNGEAKEEEKKNEDGEARRVELTERDVWRVVKNSDI